jgi:hypothetical protein
MIVFKNICDINIVELASMLNIMRIEKLNILSIDDMKRELNIIKVKEPSEVNYIELGVEEFINQINYENSDFLNYNKNTLYILRNGSYIHIKNILKKIKNKDVNLGRGGSQKSHALSPLDLRLSCYLMAMFNFDYKLMSCLNGFNIMSKNRYLPYGFNKNDS